MGALHRALGRGRRCCSDAGTFDGSSIERCRGHGGLHPIGWQGCGRISRPTRSGSLSAVANIVMGATMPPAEKLDGVGAVKSRRIMYRCGRRNGDGERCTMCIGKKGVSGPEPRVDANV